jgi:hypothetical protein
MATEKGIFGVELSVKARKGVQPRDGPCMNFISQIAAKAAGVSTDSETARRRGVGCCKGRPKIVE